MPKEKVSKKAGANKAKKQPKKRVMLLRKGWGPFGPLPLGGSISTLAVVIPKIQLLLSEEE